MESCSFMFTDEGAMYYVAYVATREEWARVVDGTPTTVRLRVSRPLLVLGGFSLFI